MTTKIRTTTTKMMIMMMIIKMIIIMMMRMDVMTMVMMMVPGDANDVNDCDDTWRGRGGMITMKRMLHRRS